MKRFERQTNLRGFGIEGQKILTQSAVLVIGAGGLGCPALIYLAAAGVGKIGIVDGDTISISNLNRQILYGQKEEGKMKSIVAAEGLREKYIDVEIEIFPLFIDNNNAFRILSSYDIIMDCTDNFSVRYMINDACLILNKPFIYAAIYEYEGQISLFHVKDKNTIAYNYRDIFPNPPHASEVPNCSATGVLGVLPGIIGTLQAAEAIKYLTGIGNLLNGKVLYYNLEHQYFYELEINHHPEFLRYIPDSEEAFLEHDYSLSCPTIELIEWNQAKKIFEQNPQQTLFIDVREIDEKPPIENIPYIQMPLSQLNVQSKNGTLPQTLILFCQHGIRSVKAATQLQSSFPQKKIYSIKRGIMDYFSTDKNSLHHV